MSIELSSTGFLNALFVAVGCWIEYTCICYMRKVRLTTLEFQETCQRNKQTVNNRSGDKAELSWNCMTSLIVCFSGNYLVVLMVEKNIQLK